MSLRIIGGERRGAHIETPPGDETRPLRDRVRQALFNTLRPVVRESVVLDAFAGSGAVGLEALSNGASRAVFVDQSKVAAGFIRRNVTKLRFEERATILEGPSPGVLSRLAATHPPLTLLFLMPPYHSGLCEAVLQSDIVRGLVSPGSMAVCEIHQEETAPNLDGWKVTNDRRYGITRLLTLEIVL